MSKIITAIAAFSAAFVGVTARPSALQARATASNFSLFAYGSDTDSAIGGYPIFYNEGKAYSRHIFKTSPRHMADPLFPGFAYIANPAKVNYTDKYVLFSKFAQEMDQQLACIADTT